MHTTIYILNNVWSEKAVLQVCSIFVSTGKDANVPKGTKVVIPITTSKNRLEESNFAKWDAVIYRQTGNSLILQVSFYTEIGEA